MTAQPSIWGLAQYLAPPWTLACMLFQTKSHDMEFLTTSSKAMKARCSLDPVLMMVLFLTFIINYSFVLFF